MTATEAARTIRKLTREIVVLNETLRASGDENSQLKDQVSLLNHKVGQLEHLVGQLNQQLLQSQVTLQSLCLHCFFA
jgi:septal ring factor EnvC (AmiA/AmiB activator)